MEWLKAEGLHQTDVGVAAERRRDGGAVRQSHVVGGAGRVEAWSQKVDQLQKRQEELKEDGRTLHESVGAVDRHLAFGSADQPGRSSSVKN